MDPYDGNVYVLVTSPSEPYQRNDTGVLPPTTKNTTCSSTHGQPWTEPGAGAAKGTTSYPYMTLFTMNTANGHLTYQATIILKPQQLNPDDPNSGYWPTTARNWTLTPKLDGDPMPDVVKGTITIGMLVAFQMLMSNFNGPVASFIGVSGQLQDARRLIGDADRNGGGRKDMAVQAPQTMKWQSCSLTEEIVKRDVDRSES